MKIFLGYKLSQSSSILLAIATFAMIFVHFFMDPLLLRQLERTASEVNGADVTIASLETHVFKLAIDVQGIEISNPQELDRNRLELGELHVPLSFLGLLQGQFIVDNAGLQNVKFDTKRKKGAQLFPRATSAIGGMLLTDLDSPGGQAHDDLHAAIELLQEQKFDLLLGRINWDKLPSGRMLDSLKNEWNQLMQSQQATLANLPSADNLSQYMRAAQAVKVPNDPHDLLTALNQLDSMQARVSGYQGQMNAALSPMKIIENQFLNRMASIKNLESLDLVEVREQIKHFNFELKTLTNKLSYQNMNPFLQAIMSYYSQVEPQLGGSGAMSLPQEEKDAARDLNRIKLDFLPKIWLKNLEIKSADTMDPAFGNLMGSIKNFRNYPVMAMTPMLVELTGNFKQKGIEDIIFKASFDHESKKFDDHLILKVGAFPIQQQTLANSKDYTIGLTQALGSIDLHMNWQDQAINLKFELSRSQAQWFSSAQSAEIRELLAISLAPLSVERVSAAAEGTWQNLAWTLSSTLSNQLQESLQSAFAKKIGLKATQFDQDFIRKVQIDREILKTQIRAQIKDQVDQIIPLQQQAADLAEVINSQRKSFKLALVNKQKAQ